MLNTSYSNVYDTLTASWGYFSSPTALTNGTSVSFLVAPSAATAKSSIAFNVMSFASFSGRVIFTNVTSGAAMAVFAGTFNSGSTRPAYVFDSVSTVSVEVQSTVTSAAACVIRYQLLNAGDGRSCLCCLSFCVVVFGFFDIFDIFWCLHCSCSSRSPVCSDFHLHRFHKPVCASVSCWSVPRCYCLVLARFCGSPSVW